MLDFLQRWSDGERWQTSFVTIILIGTCIPCVPSFVEDVIYPKCVIYVLCVSIALFIILCSRQELRFSSSFPVNTILILLIVGALCNIERKITVATLFANIILFIVLCNVKLKNNYVCRGVIVIVITILTLCLMQWIGYLRLYTSWDVTASFDNPSGVSVFLSLCFPFLLDEFERSEKVYLLLCLTLIVFAIVMLHARGGLVAIFVSLVFFLHFRKNISKFEWTIIFASFIVMFIGLCWLKSDSTQGRLFIYIIASKLLMSAPLCGLGNWGYELNAMAVQTNFFIENPNSLYGKFASDMMHPLSDVLYFVVDYGGLGLGMLLMITYQLLRNFDRKHFVYYNCILAFVVHSFISYPLRYPSTWFFVILCLSQIFGTKKRCTKLSYNIRWLLGVLCVCCLYIVTRDCEFERKWYLLFQDRQMHLNAYIDMEKMWNGNPMFFYDYARVLRSNGQYVRSNEMLGKYQKYLKDYSSYMMMADNFYSMGNYDEAMKSYIYCSHMCPARFLPLRGMLRSYQRMGEIEKSKIIANKILKKNIKVQSIEVELIRYEATKCLKK